MIHIKSESEITSLAPSSPSRSPPKRQIYYVQSPSRDSQDGDKATSMQAITPNYNSPMESPSHHSFGRHSRNSSASLFSGIFRSSSGRKMMVNSGRNKRMNDKGWPECNVIMEEGKYDDKAFTRRCQAIMAFLCFLILFTVFCLIIWGASRPYNPQVSVKSLVVNNIYMGQGSDSTGVLTKMMTVNGTLRISVYNSATFFGVHVSSSPVNLLYSDITVATGQVKKYFQPRKSRRIVIINIQGTKVPLYGAGSTLPPSTNGIQLGLTLDFEVRTRGNVVGKLVTTTHKRKVSCPVDIDSTTSKPIEFIKNKNKSACSYT